ncbi:DUF6712 family protein [Enterocloster citroniae]
MQDEIIENVIGTCLYDKLIDLIRCDRLDCPENSIYKELLDKYLFKIFAYAVQAELSIPKSFKVRNAGTIQQASDNMQQVGLSDIKYLNSWYRNKADLYINRTIMFLKCNKKCIPELCHCACSWCDVKPDSIDPLTSSLNLKIINVNKRI